MNEAIIKNRLVASGQAQHKGRKKFVTFTGEAKYDELLNDLKKYPHAFVIACVADRQIKAEKAWAIPYYLKERIGTFAFTDLYSLTQSQLAGYLNEPTLLHRYTDTMATCLHDAIQIIGERYNGDATRIWSGKPSSAAVVYRFLEIHGVGPKIATMATNILARDFKIRFSDYYSIDVSVDVQVRRVFSRLGLVGVDASTEQIIYKARSLHPEFPGLLDLPVWQIGREWCRPKQPACGKCYMNDVCPSVTPV